LITFVDRWTLAGNRNHPQPRRLQRVPKGKLKLLGDEFAAYRP
jgi:hypothetical protein